MRDFLKGLELEKDVIEKIMTEYGKAITEEKNKYTDLDLKVKGYEAKVTDYENKINELNNVSSDNAKIQKELNALKKQIADEDAKKQQAELDGILTKNILSAIGDKKFVNDYTKNYVISEVKTALQDKANTGKSASDILNDLTKDKTDIFVNPNQIQDMQGVGDVDTPVSKDAFDKMTYKERVEFKAQNPDLFKKYNS